MAALTGLKNYIRSGDVWVNSSRLQKDFEEYLVSKDDWEKAKVRGTNIAVNVSIDQYIQEKYETLNIFNGFPKILIKIKGPFYQSFFDNTADNASIME
jgi:hypothetical protein